MPSKSVPGTPFGLNGAMGNGQRNGAPPNDGLNQAQRGYSNPDLARAFGKPQGYPQMEQPRVSGLVCVVVPLLMSSLTVGIPCTPCSTLVQVLCPTDQAVTLVIKLHHMTLTVSRTMVMDLEPCTLVDLWV